MSWEEVRLGEVVDFNPKVTWEKSGAYPFVPMDAITPGTRYVGATEARQAGGGARFEDRDILFARITPCLENGKISQYRAAKTGPSFGSTEFFVLRGRPDRIDQDFLFYLSLTDTVRGPAEKSMSGATGRQRADLKAIQEILVQLPELAIQRRIASNLSVYDDLIENNTRRIAILEEMARRLFEEWFVTERGTNTGLLVRLDSLIKFDPRTKVEKEGHKPFLPMTAVETNSMVVYDWEMRAGNSGSKFRNGDTLLARITPCLENGKTAHVDFLPENAAGFGSTEFIVMRGLEVPPEFVYCLARSENFREHAIKSMSGATGRQRVSSQAVAQFELVPPDRELTEKFGEMARPMFKMVRKLADANTNLRATRDRLLPKLISGEIEVDVTEEVREVAAA